VSIRKLERPVEILIKFRERQRLRKRNRILLLPSRPQ